MRYPDHNDIVLLTGATGQLGFAWMEELRSSGITVLTPDRFTFDLSNSNQVVSYLDTYRPTFIIHCGAYTKVDLAEDEPEQCRLINTDATGLISRYASEHNVPLIYYSTDYIFSGNPEDRTLYPSGYPIDVAANPQSVYGTTKWLGEQLVRELVSDHLIVRVAWLCGAHGTNFAKTMLRLANDRTEIRVVNDQLGSPSFVADVIYITSLLMAESCSGTHHISSDGLISWADLAVEIFKYTKTPMRVIPITTAEYPTKARRPFYSKLDCSQTTACIKITMPDWKTSLHNLLDEIQH